MCIRDRRCPEEAERGIYRLPWEEERYIRMDSIPYENGTLGVILDVTEDMVEKHHIVSVSYTHLFDDIGSFSGIFYIANFSEGC